jgi:hypothetical protein
MEGLLLLLFIAAHMIILAARECRTGSSAGWVALVQLGVRRTSSGVAKHGEPVRPVMP